MTTPPLAQESSTPERHQEYQYLDLISDILKNGTRRSNRTGIDTVAVFGRQIRWNLRNNTFPLLTTKRVYYKGMVEEFLWFLKGQTNNKLLQEKGVHIWDANASREYLDSVGLTNREEGDLGPVYGFNWRHFGAQYIDCNTDYCGKGYDQVMQLINTIKTNPNDRRLIVTAWNPPELKNMALPPCHMLCQFYVSDGELSCLMHQRSCDIGLGVPFNIASYSLMTIVIANLTGLRPGEFIHSMGDSHIYVNHIEPLKEQIKREPYTFPKLMLKRDLTDIESIEYDDFELVGYKCHPKIQMEMAV